MNTSHLTRRQLLAGAAAVSVVSLVARRGEAHPAGPRAPAAAAGTLKIGGDLLVNRMGLERIDLYQLHRIDSKVPVADSLGELARLQQQGKIRHIGCRKSA